MCMDCLLLNHWVAYGDKCGDWDRGEQTVFDRAAIHTLLFVVAFCLNKQSSE